MSQETVQSLVDSIRSLKGALLVTVDDLLLYRSWQRDGEDWSVELNAARFGDVLRATVGLGQLSGDQTIDQLTIESHDAITVIEPLSDAIAAVLLFDADTPLGLVRFHLASVRAGLRQLAAGVGPVGPPASRSASALPAPTGSSSVAPPPPPPSNAPAGSAPPPPPSSRSDSPPLPPPPVPAPPAGATRPGITKVSATKPGVAQIADEPPSLPLPPEPAKVPTAVLEAFEPTEDMPAIGSQGPAELATSIADEATVDSPYGVDPPYEEPEPSTINPRTQPRPSRPHKRTSPLPGPIFTAPPKSDAPSGLELLEHLQKHAADAHTALLRVSLLSGVPMTALKDPSRLSDEQLSKVEVAARHMLGISPDSQ